MKLRLHTRDMIKAFINGGPIKSVWDNGRDIGDKWTCARDSEKKVVKRASIGIFLNLLRNNEIMRHFVTVRLCDTA